VGRDCTRGECWGSDIEGTACLFRRLARGRDCMGGASGGGSNIDAAACLSWTWMGGRDNAEGERGGSSDIDGAACLFRSWERGHDCVGGVMSMRLRIAGVGDTRTATSQCNKRTLRL
jgi:hypothetical protein